AARLVQEAAHPEANIIFGAVIDDALGDEVRVTVIAAGFDGGGPTKRQDDRALGQVMGQATGLRPQTPQLAQNNHHAAPTSSPTTPAPQAPVQAEPVHVQVHPQPQVPTYQPVNHTRPPQAGSPVPGHAQQLPTQQPPRQATFEESDDLDVPDFLK
ncbi:MAG TPA: cell division protein FtsZ, partial [Intrasporangium sp.]|nr:cell division protein FtsZ [Intrasporangium sp.]